MDHVDFTALELVELAAARGVAVVAVTLHDTVLDDAHVRRRAEERGILLIPGIERRIAGRDVVILNVSAGEAAELAGFDDLRRLRARRGNTVLLLAPHPAFILGASLGCRLLEENIDCFDAVERCHMHTRWWDRNLPAAAIARRHGKPILATSDAHARWMFGEHFSRLELDGPPTVDSVFAAIRAGRVEGISPPASLGRLLRILGLCAANVGRLWQKRMRKRSVSAFPRGGFSA